MFLTGDWANNHSAAQRIDILPPRLIAQETSHAVDMLAKSKQGQEKTKKKASQSPRVLYRT